MSGIQWVMVLATLATILIAPVTAYAAGGGKPATKIYNVADTRHMESGLSKWIADVYNDSLLVFGLLVVSIMASMGLVMGFGMDRVIAMIGIDLRRLEHHE